MTRLPDLTEFQPDPQTARGFGPPPAHPPEPIRENNSVLADKSMKWLLIGIVGLLCGLGFITGPLCWYYSSELRGNYYARGLDPSPAANWAYGLGVVVTSLVAALLVFWVLGGAGLIYVLA